MKHHELESQQAYIERGKFGFPILSVDEHEEGCQCHSCIDQMEEKPEWYERLQMFAPWNRGHGEVG